MIMAMNLSLDENIAALIFDLQGFLSKYDD